MIIEYIKAAMKNAHYEIIKDEEPYYGEIPELKAFFQRVNHWKNAATI